MKTLTKAEEQVMHALWKLEKAFLGEILEAIVIDNPHRNTVATVLKVLAEKEFVTSELVGRNHLYAPLISKEAYSKATMKTMVKQYFDGSFSNVLSFLVKEKKLSLKELEKAMQQIRELEKTKK
jgi:BlaI family penicillinase repressor